MMYQVKCSITDEALFEGFSRFECGEYMEYEGLGMGDAWIQEFISCRGCSNEGHEMYDGHGISTGYWCYECYESSRYPYRKDRYPTIETHGYGERLSEDY